MTSVTPGNKKTLIVAKETAQRIHELLVTQVIATRGKLVAAQTPFEEDYLRADMAETIGALEDFNRAVSSEVFATEGVKNADDKHAQFIAVLASLKCLCGRDKVVRDLVESIVGNVVGEGLPDAQADREYSLAELAAIGRRGLYAHKYLLKKASVAAVEG